MQRDSWRRKTIDKTRISNPGKHRKPRKNSGPKTIDENNAAGIGTGFIVNSEISEIVFWGSPQTCQIFQIFRYSRCSDISEIPDIPDLGK